MTNIIVLSYGMDMGGTEKALIAFLNFLVNENYNVDLLLLKGRGPMLEMVPSEVNVSVLPSIIRRAKIKMLRPIFSKMKKKNDLFAFLLKNEKKYNKEYDVLFDFFGYGRFMTAYGAEKICAKKKAVWFHDSAISWAEWTQKYYYKYDKLFCVSNSVKESVDLNYPEYSEKTEVLHNFIDVKEIIQKSKEVLSDSHFTGAFKILTIGRLTPQKRVDIAIKTARILKNKGIDFDWYVIGDGYLRKELQKEIQKEDINDCFHLLGQKTNPYPYLKACNLYVQTSGHEGYAITIIEARALCKPMIVTDIDANREQIEDGVTGFLVPFDENCFAQKIEYLEKNKDIREVLSNNLKEKKMDFMYGKDRMRRFIEEI